MPFAAQNITDTVKQIPKKIFNTRSTLGEVLSSLYAGEQRL